MGAVLGSSMISVVTATSEASDRTDSSSGRTDCNFVWLFIVSRLLDAIIILSWIFGFPVLMNKYLTDD